MASNLNTGLPNESDWKDLKDMNPKNSFETMKNIGDTTTFLYFNNFDFDLKKENDSHQIQGIQINILRKGSNIKDYWIDLVYPINDEIELTKNNKASNNTWPFIYTDVSYGGQQELWGRNWTLTDVNSEQFGVVVACQSTESSAMADIKKVEISVYYEELKLHFCKKELCLYKP